MCSSLAGVSLMVGYVKFCDVHLLIYLILDR